MITRRNPCVASAASFEEICDGAIDGLPTPARAPSLPCGVLVQSRTAHTDADALKNKARLEQELESDKRFFAEPPDDFVRCPTCTVVYAVHSSRPTTPTDPLTVAPLLPASYSKELARGANLSFNEAMRHMHRSRFRCAQCDTDFCRCGFSPYHWGWSCDGWQKHQQITDQACLGGAACRWCLQPCLAKTRRSETLASNCCGSDDGNDLKKFPPVLSCAERERRACNRRHSHCGHCCGGVRGEDRCLPCLHPECRRHESLCSTAIVVSHSAPETSASSPCVPQSSGVQPIVGATASPQAAVHTGARIPNGDDWCPICWTEPLKAAPSIQLACGHVLHHHCAEAFVKKGHTSGRRLTFKNIRCPLCQAVVQHQSLNALVGPQFAMYQKVRRKALQRWVVESRRPAPRTQDPVDEDRISGIAIQKMAFFECSQCTEPYYGGEVECGGPQAEEEEDLDEDVQAALAMELICRGCASKGQLQCPQHGTDFLGWKCRYCCEHEAHYFCFGTTHFCHSCHDVWQTGVDQRRKLQAGKACLGKDKCIFGGRHPPGARNGRDEYALGCTICAQDAECGIVVNRERRAARRKLGRGCVLM